jgi:AraC-like DNA-binding protein
MQFQNAFNERARNVATAHGIDSQLALSEKGQVVSAPVIEAVAAAIPGGLAPWQIKRISAHIEGNLCKKLCLDDLAAVVKLSTSYFAAAFRRNFGTSPHAYITKRRVELAKQQMAEGKLPLCEIALECGLADQAHLSRVFRRVAGMTPTAYRQRLRRQSIVRVAA